MEGPIDYISESKHTNGDISSYPTSDTGDNDGYDGSESGVEPDYAEWVFDSSQEDDVLFDMSDEQAMAALRYFTSTAQRTNMLTKTHSNDLELIANLLSDKEKDLEMTARIGQSLLQRNKQLMMKIEAMEDYLSQTNENAAQLEHDLQIKSKLVQMYSQDVETASSIHSNESKEDKSFDDQELMDLTNRCRKLEKDNQNLFSEALDLRQLTDEMEEKEETLVLDCIEQLASAKQQITQLTDEIALKFEDNLQQQMEISKLINMVVELQKKQRHLVEENEGLHDQLIESNENQENLRGQLQEMQVKFWETKELMLEYQKELKTLKNCTDSGNPCDWIHDSANSLILQDSLANEIEESVRRDLTSSFCTEKSKIQNRRLLENVRNLNIRGSDTTSGRTSPVSTWSMASDERSESMSIIDLDQQVRVRRPNKKLQIVKPLEGSDTLNKWHHLANKNVKGGLDITTEEAHPVDMNSTSSSVEDEIPHRTDSISTIILDDTDSEVFNTTVPVPKPRPTKITSPREKPVPRPRGISDVSSPQKKTIITRNSSALKSLRQGRNMLKSSQKGGRSQADVIGMIASAMGKVNVEPKAEQRILSSFLSPTGTTNVSPVKSDFTSMPNVAKALEKAAQINVKEPSEISEYDNWTEDFNSSSETQSITQSSLRTTRTAGSLHSISGPLGLLNRANPSQPDPEILNNLLRYSSSNHQPNTELLNEPKNPESNELSADLRENMRSPTGSLVNIIASNRLKSRSLGMTSMVSLDNPSLASSVEGIDSPTPKDELEKEIDADEIGRTKEDIDPINSSQISQTGLDKTGEEGAGLFGLFSFLGKLT